MSQKLVQFDPRLSDELALDDFVHKHAPFSGVAFDFMGETLETAFYARTRISPMYKSNLGLYGYLEIARHQHQIHGRIFDMLGVIDVPKSIMDYLSTDKRVIDNFVKAFDVLLDTPSNLEISPYQGIVMDEKVYYHCFHPKYQHPSDEPERLRQQYHDDLLILTGYMSKMDQWIMHAKSGQHGKTRIPYTGLALQVGNRRYKFLQEPEKPKVLLA